MFKLSGRKFGTEEQKMG